MTLNDTLRILTHTSFFKFNCFWITLHLDCSATVHKRIFGSCRFIRGSLFGVLCDVLHPYQICALQGFPRLSLNNPLVPGQIVKSASKASSVLRIVALYPTYQAIYRYYNSHEWMASRFRLRAEENVITV